jgi:uncharacterized membrane protein YkgB
MAHQEDKPTIEPTTKARAGVTGHNVRYVLVFGLAGVIIGFLLIVPDFSWRFFALNAPSGVGLVLVVRLAALAVPLSAAAYALNRGNRITRNLSGPLLLAP